MYREFNEATDEKSWWLKEVESMELLARQHGFFDLACMLQDAARALTKEGARRRDMRNVFVRRGFHASKYGFAEDSEALVKLVREEEYRKYVQWAQAH